jgi:hypothetical protein
MADLSNNFPIPLNSIFRDKFGDFRGIQQYEVVRVDTNVEPPLVWLRNLQTNVVTKESPDNVQLYYIRQS